MSDRERAREIMAAYGGAMGCDEAIATALAQARAEGLRQAAEVVENSGPATQDMTSTFICEALDTVAARLRALAEGGE